MCLKLHVHTRIQVPPSIFKYTVVTISLGMVLRFQAFVRKAIYTLPGTLCTEWCLRYRYLPGYCMHIDVAPKGNSNSKAAIPASWKLEGTYIALLLYPSSVLMGDRNARYSDTGVPI